MNRKFNLLPTWVVRKQRLHTQILFSTALTAVIFLFSILIVCLLDLSAREAWARSEALDVLLADERYAEADHIAESLKTTQALLNTRLALLETLTPAPFTYAWLVAINETVPHGAAITAIDINGRSITVTAAASDFSKMEEHRRALSDGKLTGEAEDNLTVHARLGTITRQKNGTYRYTLMVGIDTPGE